MAVAVSPVELCAVCSTHKNPTERGDITAPAPSVVSVGLIDSTLDTGTPPPDGETLQGQDTITYLANLDAEFVLLAAHNAAVSHPGKQPVKEGWPDMPETAASAREWIQRGNNVGLLCGRHDMAVLDVDSHLDDFLQAYPMIAARRSYLACGCTRSR